jgi:hypothetical protein
MTRDHQAAMAKFFEAVRARIGDERLALWFLGFEHWEVGPEEVVVSVPHPFLAECVQGFCRKDLEGCVADAFGDPRRLVIVAKEVSSAVPGARAIEPVPALRRIDLDEEKAEELAGSVDDGKSHRFRLRWKSCCQGLCWAWCCTISCRTAIDVE